MSANRRYCTINEIPDSVHICVVLGAKLKEEKYLSPILELRMEIVRKIYLKRPDMRFCLSGCRSDTTVMYRYLVEKSGMDENLFFIDHDGFNTYHSIYDMVNRYKERGFLVLTSSFHIKRTMSIAAWLHADAIALEISEFEKKKDNVYATREFFATIKAAFLAFYDVSGLHHLICHIIFGIDNIRKKILAEWISRHSEKDCRYVEDILRAASGDIADKNPVLYFASVMLGLPDRQNILRDLTTEKLIIMPRQVDCTTFIEYALAYAYTYSDGKTDFKTFCDYVRRIRYKNGEIVDYTSRNHYYSFTADNLIKQGMAKEIDGRDVPGSEELYTFPFCAKQTLKLGYMTTHHYYYPQLENNAEYLKRIRDRELEYMGMEFPYIPRELTGMPRTSVLGTVIHDGDILMVIADQCSWARGIDIKHLLIAKWIGDRLHFIHSDGMKKEVRESDLDLYTYLEGKFVMKGVRVLRPILNIVRI